VDLYALRCQFKKSHKVLELGSGTGEYSRRLANFESDLFCTDLSYNMLNKAKAKLEGRRHTYIFASDIDDLPVKEGTFDAVVGNSVLHHLPDIEQSVGELLRVLKPSGIFAFSEPNMINPQIYMQKNVSYFKKLSGDSSDETAFYRWRIEKVFKKYGFREVSCVPFDFVHPCLPRVFFNLISRAGAFFEKIPLVKEIAGSLMITGVK